MGRKIVLMLLLLMSIVGMLYGAYAFLVRHKSGVALSDTPSLANDPFAPKKFVEVPVLGNIERKNSNPEMHFSYDVYFPTLSLANNAERAREANAVVETFVNDIIDEFQNNTTDAYVPSAASNMTSDLVMRWKAELVSPTIISLRFDISEYMANTAHPNNHTKVLNYDLEQHALLVAEDLFASSSEALPFLSRFTREELKKNFGGLTDEEFAREVLPGTEPIAENFSRVAVGYDGLIVIFDTYQVAPYARGAQVVHIPLNDMAGLLSPRITDAINLAVTNIVEATPMEGGVLQ